MAARVFMRVGGEVRHGPQIRPVPESARTDCVQHAGRHADVRQHGLAAQRASGQQQMARFQAEEGDGQHGLRGETARQAGRAVQTTGHVDGDDPPRRPQHGFRAGFKVAAQARAEHGIDHEGGARGFLRRKRGHGPAPSHPGQGRVRPSPRRRQCRDRHRPSLLFQQPRHDVPVAAIVARSAQHQRPARVEPGLDRAGGGAARVFHQRVRRHPQPRRRRVRLGHFSWGQEFGGNTGQDAGFLQRCADQGQP